MKGTIHKRDKMEISSNKMILVQNDIALILRFANIAPNETILNGTRLKRNAAKN
jgi:hypothetical protein